MTASYTYVLETGTVSADTADILTDVQSEWVSAFGQAINTDSSTPQGKWQAGEATARSSVMKNNAEVTNLLNPNLSYGTHLDAVCSLLGVERSEDISTIVTGVQILGNSQTQIAAGSRIQTANGDIFATVLDITIPASGATTATVQSSVYGSFDFPVGACTILDSVIGWGAANGVSTTTVTPGEVQNTDGQLKNKRNRQLAIQGQGSPDALLAALLNVANVTDAIVVENNTGTIGTVDGIAFTLPRALWVCVDGTAVSSDIASAMYSAHNAGCPWDYGNAMGVPVESPNGVSIVDVTTGKQYSAKWTTPVKYDVYVNASFKQSAAASPGVTNIQQAMTDYANGLVAGEDGLIMGAGVSAFELSGAVTSKYPGVYAKDCRIAIVAAGAAAPVYPDDYIYEKDMLPYERGVLQAGNISLSLT